MDDYVPFPELLDGESEEYSLETEIQELLRQPLVDIIVALMLINDIFLYLRHDL
jgi:hypothetical protein